MDRKQYLQFAAVKSAFDLFDVDQDVGSFFLIPTPNFGGCSWGVSTYHTKPGGLYSAFDSPILWAAWGVPPTGLCWLA